MKQNLFTGKCGFIVEDKIKIWDLLLILAINLAVGYLVGLVFSQIDADVFENAVLRVGTYDVSMPFFIKSVFCGIIMYVAVKMYKEGTALGIIFGVPLFIFCGFQHCIANVITLGVAQTFDLSLIVCVIGNLVGSLLMWLVTRQNDGKRRASK